LKDKSGNSLIVIGLNSCTRGGVLKDWARGEIGESQRKELADILRKCSPKTPKLLFLHHIPNKEAEWAQFMTLMDWQQLMEVVRGKVDVLAFGHQGQLDIDYDKSLTWKALSRPMQVRSFERDHFTFEGGKPMTVLDANASVSELACYRIIWDGLQPQPKAEIIDFG
jgi:hypothetical protein